MRNHHAKGMGQSGSRGWGYPGPSDPHPVYMYGLFRADFPASIPAGRADEALLGIRETAEAVLPGLHAHHHADGQASADHLFMFGVAPEQTPVLPPDEPAFCFWDVGVA